MSDRRRPDSLGTQRFSPVSRFLSLTDARRPEKARPRRGDRRPSIEWLEQRLVMSNLPNIYVDSAWASDPAGTDPDGTGPAMQIGVDAFATIGAAVGTFNTGQYDHIDIVANPGGQPAIPTASANYAEAVQITHNSDLISVIQTLDGSGNATSYSSGGTITVNGTGDGFTLTQGAELVTSGSGVSTANVTSSSVIVNRSGSAVNGGTRISDALTLVSPGGTVQAFGPSNAANQYTAESSVSIKKNVQLVGILTSGNMPTTTAFVLSNGAQLVAGSTGITAPTVTVNAGSLIKDGINLSSSVVNLDGTFTEDMALNKAVTVQTDPAAGSALSTIVAADATGGAVTAAGTVKNLILRPNGGTGTTLSVSANNATITGDTFDTPGADQLVLASGVTGTTVSGNTFSANQVGANPYVTDSAGSPTIPSILASNTFLRSVYDELTPGTGTLPQIWANIQPGIDAASAGNTVHVGPGTYNESPTVNKSVILSGAGSSTTTIALLPSGTAGTAYLAPLSITGAGNTDTVSGFTIAGNDAVGSGLANSDIVLGSGLGQVTIQSNRIEVPQVGSGTTYDDGFGLLTTYTTTASQSVGTLTVTGNQFVPLHATGSAAFFINPGVTNFSFTNNTITGDFTNTSTTSANTGLVQGNTVTGTGVAGSRSEGIGGFGYPDASTYGHTTFSDNVLTNLDAGIGLYSTSDTTVSNNTFTNDDYGVYVDDTSYPVGAVESTNHINDNSFATTVTTGVDASHASSTIDATDNWWGSFRGPTTTANPGGNGSAVTANVTFSPWLSNGTDSDPNTLGFQPVAGQPLYAVPTQLVFTTEPSSTATQGTAFATQPVVTAEDAAGNLGINFDNATKGSTVTLTLDQITGTGGSLSGTTTVNALNGVATFSGLSISQPGAYQLVASQGGSSFTLTPATTNSTTININYPVPTATSLSDATVPVGQPGITETITGSGFYTGATVVHFVSGTNSFDLIPASISSDHMTLTVSVPASDLTAAQTYNVTVSDPAPGGGTSSPPLTLTVANKPADVYVDASYTGASPGTVEPGSHTIGYDAFATVQGGVNGVASGGRVHVAAGTYAENVSINQPLSLLGPYATTDGAAASRGTGEAIIEPGTDSPSIDGADNNNLISVLASNVTIAGLTLTGRNDALTGGFTFKGITTHAADAMQNTDGDYNAQNVTIDHWTVQNNIIEDFKLQGIYGATSDSNTNSYFDYVNHNLFDTIYNEGIQFAQAMPADIEFNTFRTVRRAASVDTWGGTAPAGFTPQMSNNTITLADTGSNSKYVGLWLNNIYTQDATTTPHGPSYLVSDNSITVDSSLATKGADGIWVTSILGGAVADVTGNTIVGNGHGHYGYYLWNTSVNATLNGGSMSGITNTGVYLTNVDSYLGFGDSYFDTSSQATLNDLPVTVQAGATGIDVEWVSGSPYPSIITLTGGTSVTGGGTGTGILVNGARASVNSGTGTTISGFGTGVDIVGGTGSITGNTISGNTTGIKLESGAVASSITGDSFVGTTPNTTDIQVLDTSSITADLTNDTFDASLFFIDDQSTAQATLNAISTLFGGNDLYTGAADGFAIERKIHHRVDTDLPTNVTLVIFDPNNIFITGNAANSDHSIQRGIDVAPSTAANVWTVNVQAGTYVENSTDNPGGLYVSKPLHLVGSQAGVDARTRTGAESVIQPSVSDPDPNSNTAVSVVYVASSNVTIDGFTVDGDNPGLTSGVTFNGADIDAAEGIVSYDGVGGITVQNNIVENTTDTGVTFYNYYNNGAVTTGNLITHNLIRNLGGGGYEGGLGVLIYNNFYVDVTANTMSEVAVGVQTGNYNLADTDTRAGTPSISNNTIDAYAVGIFYNLHYESATPFSVSGNAITASVTDDPSGPTTDWDGMLITSQNGAGATFSGNTVDGTNAATYAGIQTVNGYNVWNDAPTSPMTISGGTVTGVEYGVYVNTYEGYPDPNNLSGPTSIAVSGLTITGATGAGVYVEDSPQNTNHPAVSATISATTIIGSSIGVEVSGSHASATVSGSTIRPFAGSIGVSVQGGSASVDTTTISFAASTTGAGISVVGGNLTIGSGDMITGGTYGLAYSGAASTLGGDTLNNLVFAGQSIDYILLSGRALVGQVIDGTGASYDGTLGSNATDAQGYAIEDKIVDALDDPTLGYVRVRSGSVFVTPTDNTAGAVGRGVAVAVAGDTVKLENGTYTEANVAITRAITVMGQSRSGVTITPSATDSHDDSAFGGTAINAFVISSPNVTIEDLTVDGGSSLNFRDAVVTAAGSNVGGITVNDVAVNRTYYRGVFLASTGHVTGLAVTGSTFSNVGASMAVATVSGGYAVADLQGDITLSGDTVTNGGGGFYTNYAAGGTADAPLATIGGNTIGGVLYGMQLVGLAGGSTVGGTGSGTTATSGNSITTGGVGGVGIIVQYAAGSVTLQGNTINSSGGDDGIVLYHDTDPANPVQVIGNTLSSTSSTAGSPIQGIGIALTDDGTPFRDATAATFATLTGNTVSNYVTGVELNQDQASGGSDVFATLTGNSVTGGTTGLYVLDSGSGGTSRMAIATVNGTGPNANNFSGQMTGILVQGGAAALTGVQINPIAAGTGVSVVGGSLGIATGDAITGGTTGLVLSGPTTALGNGRLSNLAFSGQSGNYITLSNGALVGRVINGTNASYDGVVGSSATETQGYAIEDKITDALDDPTLGYIRIQGGSVFVTPTDNTAGAVGRGVAVAVANDTVHVENGTYTEANVAIAQPITVTGQSQAGVKVTPSATDSHDNSAFGGTAINAFVIDSSGVTIEDLTIDGGAPTNQSPGLNFRDAVVSAANSNFGTINVNSVTANNIYYRGVFLASTGLVNGLSVTGDTFSGVGANVASTSGGYAVADLQGNISISGNTVTNGGGGFFTNYGSGGSADAPVATITGNTIGGVLFGMHLVGLGGGSTVGGATSALGNTITTEGAGGVGIIVQYAAGSVTVQGNTIHSSGGDAGIVLYHDSDPSNPVIVTGNTLASTGSTTAGPGMGIGIALTDDGRPFGDVIAPVYATLTGNTVSGYVTGVELNQDQTTGGSQVSATLSGNSIGGTTGLLVNGAGTPGLASATLTGSNTIGGVTTGIDVNGGSASIGGATVTASGSTGTGITIENGGQATVSTSAVHTNTTAGTGILVNAATALIQTTDLTGNHVGLMVENGATVDAGSDSGHANFTTLGTSTGGNTLTGYTGAGGNYAIFDGNLIASGQPNVQAENNNFGPNSTNTVIAQVIYDHARDSSKTYVNYTTTTNHQTQESPVYVNQSYAGTALGGTTSDGHTFGVDAFTTIQDGVNGVSDGGTVFVAAGNYRENVVIQRGVTLSGPNASISGTSNARNAEAIIDPTSGLPISVQSATGQVSILGFTVDSVAGQDGIDDASPNAGENLTVSNNILGSSGTGGVGINLTSVASLTAAGDAIAGYGTGIRDTAQSSSATATISSSSISGVTGDGVDLFLGVGTTTPASLTGNTISGASGGSGISLTGGSVASITGGNSISGFTSGISLTNSTATISGDTLSGNTTGISQSGGTATITGDTLSGNTTGISQSGGTATITGDTVGGTTAGATGIALTSAAVAGITGDTFTGNTIDLNLTGNSGGTITGGTLTGDSFSGSEYYIDMGSSQNLDATGATFSESNPYRIEDRIFHKVDNLSLGLVTYVANNLYVTAPGTASTGSTDTDSTIQRGIEAAPTSPYTVNVEAGTFAQTVTLDQGITLVGQGSDGSSAGTTITPPSGSPGVTITANSATLKNFRIAGTSATTGIEINSAVSGDTITNVASTGNGTGLMVDTAGSATNLTLNGVNFSNDNVGFSVATTGAVNGLTVSGGHFDNDNYGWVIAAGTGGSANNAAGFTNINVNVGDNAPADVTTFDSDAIKGLYAEKINAATLNNIESVNSGTSTSSGGTPEGIDLNLKNGTYANVTISRATVTNSGTGAANGVGLIVDGNPTSTNYPAPGVLNGLTLTNDTITGSPFDLSLGDNLNNVTMTGDSLSGPTTGPAGSPNVGLIYFGTTQGLNVGDTAFASSLTGYIADVSPFGVDATHGATFGGFNTGATANAPTPANLATFFAIDDKILDGVDVPNLGLVRLHAGDVFVTQKSFYNGAGTPTTTSTPSIQRGINAASANDTVYVQAGPYAEDDVNVNKTVSVVGQTDGTAANTPTTILTPTANGSGNLMTVSANGVSVANLAVENSDGAGIAAQNTSGLTLTNVDVTGSALIGLDAGYTAYVNGSPNSAISNLTIVGGSYSNNGQDGIYLTSATTTSLTNVTASNDGDAGLDWAGPASSGLSITGGTFSNDNSDGISATGGSTVSLSGVTADHDGNTLGDSGVFLYQINGIAITGGDYSNNGLAGDTLADPDNSSGIDVTPSGGTVTIGGTITANSNAGSGLSIRGGNPTSTNVGQTPGDSITLSGNGLAGLYLAGNVPNAAIKASFTNGGVAGAYGALIVGLNSTGTSSPTGASLDGSRFAGYSATAPAITLALVVPSPSPKPSTDQIGTADVSARNTTFNGVAPSTSLTEAQADAITAEVYDKSRDNTLGRVILVTGVDFATPTTGLQPVLDAAADGDEVLIYANPSNPNYGETNHYGGKSLELVGVPATTGGPNPTTNSIELQSGARVLAGSANFQVPTVTVDSGALINDGVFLAGPNANNSTVTVNVGAGTFNESVALAKSLTLTGVTGSIINTPGGDGIDVTGTGTTDVINGLTITGATGSGASGINVGPGTKANLTGDNVSGNATGVTVNGGTARLSDDTLSNDTVAGLTVTGGAIVDAGQAATLPNRADFTGFGISPGGNIFHGYTAGGPYAIINNNTGTINGVNYGIAGSNDTSAGQPQTPTPHYDTLAQGNDFNVTGTAAQMDAAIEAIVLHDLDSISRGFVRFAVNKPDVTPPTSTVNSVALGNNQSSTTFTVPITASDPTSATNDPDETVSGVGTYNLYYKVHGSSTFLLYNSSPVAAPVMFTGNENTLYDFYSQAIDNAGNSQPLNPTTEATTFVPDLTAPTTQVNSVTPVYDNSSGTPIQTTSYTVNYSGYDPGAGATGLSKIELYVIKNGGTPTLLTTVMPNSTGNTVYNGTYNFVAPRDGNDTFRFYTIGYDNRTMYNGTAIVPGTPNMEAAPAAPDDVTIQTTFSSPMVVSTSVQNNSRQRSFIRYVDITLNDPNLVAELIAHPNRVVVNQFGDDGVTVVRQSVMNLTITATPGNSNSVRLDFGQGGVGGAYVPGPNNPADQVGGNGLYQVNFDFDGDGQNTNSYVRFYRLLGDLNGGTQVQQSDINVATIGASAPYNAQFDTDGDGRVNNQDKTNTQTGYNRAKAGEKITGTYTA